MPITSFLTQVTPVRQPGYFERDGEPHQIISGALHYFRVPRQLWADRLQRLAAMGCNTVETYVAWNFHQPWAGTSPDFTDDRDLGNFLDLAASLDLDILVRPGPYICAEWDFGGLPSWLLAEPQLINTLRTSDPAFLRHVDQWFDSLLPIIVARQASHGGRVVGIQVENEYGSYGNDHGYLEHLRDGLLKRGADALLFTSDGPEQRMLANGTLDNCLAGINFGSGQEEAFATLRNFRPGTPTICMEFWNGWFDHWGTNHHVRSAEEVATELRQLLAAGHSVNLYLAHGGTNFGVWAGANNFDSESGPGYRPTTTSYDYDAPIAEDGTLTPKYWAFRSVITDQLGHELPAPPADLPRLAAQRAQVSAMLTLESVLDEQQAANSRAPRSFEALGVHHGVVRYRTHVAPPVLDAELRLAGLADLATVKINSSVVGRLGRASLDPDFPTGCRVSLPADSTQDIVVSSLGRVNFGPRLWDPKGLSSVRLDDQYLYGFEQAALDLTVLPRLDWSTASSTYAATDPEEPQAFHRAVLTIAEPADGYLRLPNWRHGYVFLNGFNLGRYWNSIGPQQTLYAPAPLWHPGDNEVVVLELVRPGRTVELTAAPDLGKPEAFQPG